MVKQRWAARCEKLSVEYWSIWAMLSRVLLIKLNRFYKIIGQSLTMLSRALVKLRECLAKYWSSWAMLSRALVKLDAVKQSIGQAEKKHPAYLQF